MEETCISGYQQASASRFVTHTTVRVLNCKLGRINGERDPRHFSDGSDPFLAAGPSFPGKWGYNYVHAQTVETRRTSHPLRGP